MSDKEMVLEIKNPALIILLIILSVLFFFELQVTLNTPIAFGDEGYHTRMSQWIGENLEYPKWVPFRLMNLAKRAYTRPPLWSMLQGSLIMIFGFQEILIKFFTPFIAFLVGIASFLLIKKLYNDKIGLMASIMLATIPSFIVYAVTFYTDALETLYLTMFFFLFIIGLKKDKRSYLLAASCFGVLGYFTKKTGLITFGFIFIAFIYELSKGKSFSQLFKKYAVFFVIMLALSSTLILRTFVTYGGFCDIPIFDLPVISSIVPKECDQFEFESEYEYSGRVEEVGSEKTILGMGVLNYLTFTYGNIWFVIFGAFAGGFIFFLRRKKKDLLVLSVLLLYIPILIQSYGRSEDAARFALPWAPVICLLAAVYFNEVYKFIRTYQRHIAVILFLVVIFFSYQNFADKIGVMDQVKQFYPSFFVACDWISENIPEDALVSTLWVHRASYCTQRRVAIINADMALSNDVDYILDVASQLGITHIWINKFSIDLQNQHLSEMIDLSYVQLLESNPEHFEKMYETGPPMTECVQQLCDGNIIYEIVY